MEPRFRVTSERLEKPGIEHTTPGLEGEQLNHYAMEAYSDAWKTAIRSESLDDKSQKSGLCEQGTLRVGWAYTFSDKAGRCLGCVVLPGHKAQRSRVM